MVSINKKKIYDIKTLLENREVLKHPPAAKNTERLKEKWFSSERLCTLNLLSLNPALSKYDIGKFSYGDRSPVVLNFGGLNSILKIGSFCSIATGVTIMLGGEHHAEWITTYPFNLVLENVDCANPNPYSKGDVIIGNDVWVGRKALILSGVTIGDGAIVGARSVVAKDVAPYSIVAGNPARLIRKRFDEKTIKKLLEIKWWNWDLEKIKTNLPLLLSDNVDKFLEENYSGH
jgi:acetyltransferase-like isoleucine patch superfamily enzyme